MDLAELAKSDKRSKEELAEWQRFRTADMQVARFRGKQLLGDEKAGFDYAVRWSSSTDRQLRKNAVAIFSGIMDSESIAYLRTLTRDPVSSVALSAKVALESAVAQTGASEESGKVGQYALFLVIGGAVILIMIGGIFLMRKKAQKQQKRGEN